MNNFTPISAIIGGILIGIAAVILLLFNGKILGVSGIVSRAIFKPVLQSIWSWVFLLGLILGAAVYRFIFPGQLMIVIEASPPVLILAGLLVGFGTRLGSGCTSGHGICGIARFSKRSIVATGSFMLFGMMIVYLMKNVLGG